MKNQSPFAPVFDAVFLATDPNALNQAYESLLTLLTAKSKQFQQLPHPQIQTSLQKLFNLKLSKPDVYFIRFMEKLSLLAYSSKSRLRHIIYQIIPDLMILLQKHHSSEQQQNSHYLKGIDTVILTIYNNECHQYKKYQQSSQMKINDNLKQLLKPSETVFFANIDYKQMDKIDFFSKSIKTFILFLYYYTLPKRSQQSIVSFFRLIYIYCGGKSSKEQFELYLLNKSNDQTLFVHRVSEEEIEWILLILYYVYVNYKHLKFEVISALSNIRKKTANESKFRVYEVAQSMLHLFQNEYEDVF